MSRYLKITVTLPVETAGLAIAYLADLESAEIHDITSIKDAVALPAPEKKGANKSNGHAPVFPTSKRVSPLQDLILNAMRSASTAGMTVEQMKAMATNKGFSADSINSLLERTMKQKIVKRIGYARYSVVS